ncbi:SDR family NAD(P)-dependent oxidoreductase [Escherichia coli]|uniref:SDR family NAD(P)-dependent oxidoreductase n=1 Tax=Escherichia coli TaxID=562 RepID=UPI0039A452DA|nr:SDR family NAD(P)-dependent oxidoreductase [Escherichia coli]
MTLDLTGKVAVVSGSTSGIGQGIAAGLAKAGVTVVVVGRKQRGVDDAIAAIAAQTPTASLRGVVADLSTESGVAIPGDMINYGVTKAANLAVYLASPLSSATTGAALRVDGGVVDTLTM